MSDRDTLTRWTNPPTKVVIDKADLLRLCDLSAPAVGDSWEDDDFDFVQRMEALADADLLDQDIAALEGRS